MNKNIDKKILDLISADLVLYNGKVVSMDNDGSTAQAVATKGDKIFALGNNDFIRKLVGPNTEEIDLHGRTLLPGMIDSHCHPDIHALLLKNYFDISWPTVRSVEGCLKFISDKIQEFSDDRWFLAYGYNDQKLGGYPNIKQLDDVAGQRPVFILRTDNHIGIANSSACDICGVDKDTPNPEHGQFDRDPDTGELTGLMREDAIYDYFLKKINENDTLEDMVAALPQLLNQYLRNGITSLHNSLTSSDGIRAYQILRDRGKLPLRIGIIVSAWEEGLIESFVKAGMRTSFGDEWIRIIGVEWCPDCSTSGRTAAYYEPYVGTAVPGEPTPNYGFLLETAEDMKKQAGSAHKGGLRVCMEGLGDRGIDFTLDVFEALLAEHPKDDHRMRVEHCSFVTPKILKRLKALNVIDASATGFIYELGDAHIANRGEENMKWMFPHRALIDACVPAPGHSDAQVCDLNPMKAIYSLVNRKTDTGRLFGPEQAITVEEAVRAYTTLGAYASFEENIKGSIEVGKLADMVVLENDIFTMPKEEIKDLRVDMTIIGGIVKYSR